MSEESIPVRGIRVEVLDFARQMERVMRRNEREKGKGDSWKTCPITYLDSKLEEEYYEAREVPHDPEENVDVAVVSMFRYWRELRPEQGYEEPAAEHLRGEVHG